MKLKYILLTVMLLFVAASGQCQSQLYKFKMDTLERTYIVHLPKYYDANKTYSLVFSFHGMTDSASGQENYTGMDDISDLADFIVVYPNAIAHSWNVGIYGSYSHGIDDVGFVSKMIDTISAKYKIDNRRVYACGWSDGAFMCYRLACQLSNRIAAIASVCGSMTDSMVKTCQNSCAVPIIELHGTYDPEVPYWGSATGHGAVDSVIQFWLNRDNCKDTFEYHTLDNCKTDTCGIEEYIYKQCKDSSEVRKYEIVGGGHTWPGAPLLVSYLGRTDYDINANVEIWEFFKSHRLQCGVVTAIKPEDILSKINVYPNPCSSELHIDINEKRLIDRISLIDIFGRNLYSSSTEGKSFLNFSTSSLSNGIYFLKVQTAGHVFLQKVIKAGN